MIQVLPALLLGTSIVGCHDHRISLSEFMVMEQEFRQSAMAIEVTDEAEALIDRELGPYKVGPGDVLSVTLTNLERAEAMPALLVRVDRDGQINLSNVPPVKVSGLELEDVEDAIHNAYVPAIFREAVVYATLVEARTTNVLVKGAVTLPGMVRLPRTERNLLFALVAAGGVSDIASGKVKLRRIRRPTEEIVLDLNDPEGVQAALALEPLENGDIVTVHAAMPNTIFVGGLVNAPLPQAFPAGVEVSVLQALAGSGGLRTDVTPRVATLIRRMPDGKDIHVKLNLGRIAKGKDPNITLAAGDILWVPETLETKIQDFINRNFFVRAGVSVNYNVTGIEFLNRRNLQGRFGGGRGIEDQFDPFGFLTRGSALQALGP